jgi:hypothetical protein
MLTVVRFSQDIKINRVEREKVLQAELTKSSHDSLIVG